MRPEHRPRPAGCNHVPGKGAAATTASLGPYATAEKYLTNLELLPLIEELAQELFQRVPDAD